MPSLPDTGYSLKLIFRQGYWAPDGIVFGEQVMWFLTGGTDMMDIRLGQVGGV